MKNKDEYFIISEEEFYSFVKIFNEIQNNIAYKDYTDYQNYNYKCKNYISHTEEHGYKWEHNTNQSYYYKDKIVLESYYCPRNQDHIYSINATFFEENGYKFKRA